MSYETRYAAKMMTRQKEYYESAIFAERVDLENLACKRADDDVSRAYPDGINSENAKAILEYQRERILAHRRSLGV